MKEFWTPTEKRFLRDQHQRLTAAEIVQYLGRHTVTSVYRVAQLLGLKKDQHWKRPPTGWQTTLRARHAEQWSDSEIAAELRMDRRYLSELRTRLGLKPNNNSDRRRRKVALKTRAQCRQAGVKSLGELRAVLYRGFSAKHGWPHGLRPRAVQILELLFAEFPVPLSRRQIAARLGMPWKGSRASLCSNDTEGSYLAHLAARGLVIRSPRTAPVGVSRRGNGQGCGVCLYTLTPAARKLKSQFLSQKGPSHAQAKTDHVTADAAVARRIAHPEPPAGGDRKPAHRRVARQDR